jgi:PAS domain S-box-containing protein
MKKNDLPEINILGAILEGMDDGVVSHDLQDTILYWNRAAQRIFGFSVEEICGRSFYELVPAELQEEHRLLSAKVRSGERVADVRTHRLTKGGQIIPVSLIASPVRDVHGRVVGITHIVSNIAELQRIEESHKMLTSIIDNSDDAVISRTMDGIITSWNKGAETLFGYSSEEMFGKPVLILIPPERRDEEDLIVGKIKKGENVQHFQTERLSKGGRKIAVSLTESPVRDPEGKITGISKIARDITAKRFAEEKQAFLAAIVENSDDAIISKTLDGIITTWNQGAERIFGYTAEEATGKHISILIPPERMDEETTIIESIRRGDKIDHFQTVRVHKNGTRIDISLTVSPVKDAKGTIIGASKIARDITRQNRALEAARRNAERLEVLHSVGKMISEKLDIDLILKKVIDATTQITGATYGAFFYRENNDRDDHRLLLTPSGVPNTAFEALKAASEGILDRIFPDGRVIRVDNVNKDEQYLLTPSEIIVPASSGPVLSYLAVPVVAANGGITGGLFFGHPSPGMFSREHEHLVASLASQAAVALENSRLFEQVIKLSRKKDEFIALASHELKTPITSLYGFLQLLQMEASPESQQFFVQKSLTQLEKLTTLINDLLDISRIQAGKLQFRIEEFDLVEFIRETVDTYGRISSSHVINFAEEGSYVVAADRIRLEQVMANLINNAIKYSPDAIAIDIYLRKLPKEIAVCVRDYGYGISRENLANLFTQFYRAKNVARKVSGLGLGLYVSKEIVERHGGRIWVETEENKGSVFTFTLPFCGD